METRLQAFPAFCVFSPDSKPGIDGIYTAPVADDLDCVILIIPIIDISFYFFLFYRVHSQHTIYFRLPTSKALRPTNRHTPADASPFRAPVS
jgi:hypothetical protein